MKTDKSLTQPRRRVSTDQANLSRVDYVYQHLRKGLKSGEFKPGDRLREVELADQLGVSRTPIREAIRRLVAEGLVEVAPNRGFIFLQLTKQQVRELYALRKFLEGAAARLAAQHASLAEMEVMRELVEDPQNTSGDPHAVAEINFLFHQAIHEAAHNRYLAAALVQLENSLSLLPGTTFQIPERIQVSNEDHLAILDAIEKRDADQAESLARNHIQLAGLARMRMMFGRSGPAPTEES